MKLALATLISVLTVAPAFAAGPVPLIEKYNNSGYVAPEWARNETCQIFADKVVRIRSFGVDTQHGVDLRDEHAIQLTGDVALLINNALKESEKKGQSQMCDGPTTTIMAHKVGAKAGDKGFVLYSSESCGTPSITREGPNSAALTAIVDTYCPETVKTQEQPVR